MADEHEAQSSTEDEFPVESLVQGRAKRTTAGGRMSALLDAAADDELALLFEEVDDDNEFAMNADEEAGEEEDMGMESSSDDEDQGPNARADEFEGENQIQNEERAEKKKRRVQQDLRYKIVSKKVKIDPTAVSAPPGPAPRPKKKSERISWIPTPDEGPTRSSSRRQTMHNKEMTHARLKDSEEKRIRLIATMEEAAKRKAHLKPKELTQAQRLAEAAKVERHNSKSLNRWEEMEKRKAEERRAKIEALQNRRLEGPVMSYWSGIATWTDGKLTRVGKVDITPKPEKEDNNRKKSKKVEKDEKNVAEQKPTAETAAAPAIAQGIPRTTQDTAQPLPSAPGEPPKQPQDETQPPKLDSDQASGVKPEETAPKATAEESVTQSAPTIDQTHTPVPNDEAKEDGTKENDTPKTLTSDLSKEQTVEALPKPPHEASKKEPPSPVSREEQPDESPKDAMQVDIVPTPDDVAALNTENRVIEPAEKTVEEGKEGVSGTPVAAPSKPEDVVEPSEKPPQEPQAPALDSSAVQPPTSKEAATPLAISPTTLLGAASTPAEASQSVEAVPSPKDKESSEMHVDGPTGDNGEPPQPEIPRPPPVIEKTGRNLTVLENFDDKTAHSREFSIYFNAKKPPRLIRPAGVAASGVPARFLDPDAPPEPKESEKKEEAAKESSTTEKEKQEGDPKTLAPNAAASTPVSAPSATPTIVTAGAGEPMDIDK
ncbi:hypothetical protein FE257_010656 [Aspergillus nanangensis]|uniref:Vps72/YL1 N-terminal domain-containing protein n=1 Tax=Aspergillus nanangensis TaxID=2582783 RepID=A0AAD4CID3_ASPNN|nr:hypothetical protein FE257_010656 [Aspergillus nanangensis]